MCRMRCTCCACWREEWALRNFLLDHPQPELFGQSQLGRYQPVYIAYHLLWFGLFFAVWIVDLQEGDPRYPIYLTNWFYITLMLCAGLETASAVYHFTRTRRSSSDGAYESMPLLYKITWVFHNIVIIVGPIITILYWGFLYVPGKQKVGVVNVTSHLLNSVYPVLNVLLVSGIPVRVYHFWHAAMFGLIYVIFSTIYYFAGGTGHGGTHYIYSILDYRDNPKLTTILILGLFIVVIPLIQLIMYAMYRAKLAMCNTCRRETYHFIEDREGKTAMDMTRTDGAPGGSAITAFQADTAV